METTPSRSESSTCSVDHSLARCPCSRRSACWVHSRLISRHACRINARYTQNCGDPFVGGMVTRAFTWNDLSHIGAPEWSATWRLMSRRPRTAFDFLCIIDFGNWICFIQQLNTVAMFTTLDLLLSGRSFCPISHSDTKPTSHPKIFLIITVKLKR